LSILDQYLSPTVASSYAEGLDGFSSLIALPSREGIYVDEMLRTLFITIPKPDWDDRRKAIPPCVEIPQGIVDLGVNF
jgi:hypothetical protein